MTRAPSILRRFVLLATPALALALVLTPVVLSTPAVAATLEIVVGPGDKSYPLGLPYTAGDTEAGKALHAVITRDLNMTGYFEIKDPKATIDTGGLKPGTFEMQDWRSLSVGAVAKTGVQVVGNQITVQVWIYHVGSGEKLRARQFSGVKGQERMLAHRVAKEILVTLTGESGFFGSRLAAVGKRKGGNKEIYVMDFDGSGIAPVTRNGSINISPAWSPDGARIAWTSYKRMNPDVYVKDLATGRTRVLSASPGINVGAAFSPDGSKVALSRSKGGDSDIYVLDARTGKVLKRVTQGGGIDVGPSWSPDGGKIAFASGRSGGSQIFVYDMAGGGTPKRVSRQGSMNTDPVWSPDGTMIAFVGRDPGFDIFIADVASGRNRRITQHMGDNEDPTWSPDGNYVAFSSTRTGASHVWLATLDGKHQHQVTQGRSGWTQPTWTP